jgi:hypothetical protein
MRSPRSAGSRSSREARRTPADQVLRHRACPGGLAASALLYLSPTLPRRIRICRESSAKTAKPLTLGQWWNRNLQPLPEPVFWTLAKRWIPANQS